MKLYRKIIHPYLNTDDKKCVIEGYKGRWFSQESEPAIMEDIYNRFHNDGETKVAFFRRYPLRWDIRHIEVSLTTTMDAKIEDLKIKKERLTRPKDKYECRCANCDEIEEWVKSMGGRVDKVYMCDNCPIKDAMNKLAEYEDLEE